MLHKFYNISVYVDGEETQWQRFAPSEELAHSQALRVAEREWPEAASLRVVVNHEMPLPDWEGLKNR